VKDQFKVDRFYKLIHIFLWFKHSFNLVLKSSWHILFMYAFTASPIFQMAQSDQKSLLTLTVVKIDIKKESCHYFLVGDVIWSSFLRSTSIFDERFYVEIG